MTDLEYLYYTIGRLHVHKELLASRVSELENNIARMEGYDYSKRASTETSGSAAPAASRGRRTTKQRKVSLAEFGEAFGLAEQGDNVNDSGS